jgi:Sep-tRNA:Cys-tRNA synthetase
MKVAGFDVRDRDEDYININPLQTAGKTYVESRKAVASYVDGYSVCDWCGGDICSIEKPQIKGFLEDVSGFLGMDQTILTNGCREAKYAVLHSLTSPGDSVVVDGNKHYTTYVAAERAGLNIFEVESSGHPKFQIAEDDYAMMFDRVKDETGSLPKLAILTHVDGNYGNIVDAKKVGKICREYQVPFLLNTAYSEISDCFLSQASGRTGYSPKAGSTRSSRLRSWAAPPADHQPSP